MSDNCELELLSAVKSDRVKSDLIQRIDELAAKLTKKDPTKPAGVIYAEAADRIAAEMKGEAANYKLQLINEYNAREKRFENLEQYVATGVKPERAFREVLAGVAEAALATGARAISRFVTDLERAGLDAQFYLISRDRPLVLDLMRELQQLNKKRDAQPGITKNPRALEMAQLFKKHVDPLRAELKKSGLRVADLEGRIFKQLWSRENTLRATPTSKEFIDSMRGRVDRIGDTYVADMGEGEFEKVMGDFYNEVLLQVVPEPELSARDLIMERKTYAVRQGLSRVIHFKTVEDELFALETFGGADVGQLMTDTIRDLAEQVHRTQELGINYRATTYAMIKKAAELGGDEARILRGAGTLALTPENILNKINGFHDSAAANPKLAMWSDAVHNYTRAAFLPLAAINTLTDLPTLNAANRRQGVESARNVVSAITRILTRPDLPPEIAREAGGVFEMAAVHALGTMHRYITLPGLDHAIYNGSVFVADRTFKWFGLNKVTRSMKQTAYIGYSDKLASLVETKTAWSDLPAANRQTMLGAGLTQRDWEKLLASEKAVFRDGRLRFVNTEALGENLGAKVNAAMSRFVSGEAVLSPDLLTQSLLDMGTQRGTWSHSFIRQMSFLMGYPSAFLTQAFRREMEFSGALSAGMARYVAALTMMGMMVVVAGDLARGRTRDYEDPEILNQVLMEGILKGGGLTIFGETLWKTVGAAPGVHHLLFGDNAQYSMQSGAPFNPTSDILVGGGVEWAWTLGSGVTGSLWDLMTGEVDKAVEGVIKTTQRTAPFVNAPGIKPLLEATVFDALAEMVDSDMMETAERRWNARTGGDFLLTDFEP